MNNTCKNTLSALLVIFTFLTIHYTGLRAQDQKSSLDEKVLKAIAGDYEFEIHNQIQTMTFIVDKGKLKMKMETKLEPLDIVDAKGYTFEMTSPGGDVAILEFKKDKAGIFDTCTLEARGMVIEGIKVKKKK